MLVTHIVKHLEPSCAKMFCELLLLFAATTTPAGQTADVDWALGLSASALSGLSSAYAGVYFEKYVKGRMSSTLWIRNLQLGIYGLPLSIAYMFVKDHVALRAGGAMRVSCFLLACLCTWTSDVCRRAMLVSSCRAGHTMMKILS